MTRHIGGQAQPGQLNVVTSYETVPKPRGYDWPTPPVGLPDPSAPAVRRLEPRIRPKAVAPVPVSKYDQDTFAQQCVQQYDAGRTQAEIADLLGSSPKTVRRALRRAHITPRPAWRRGSAA